MLLEKYQEMLDDLKQEELEKTEQKEKSIQNPQKVTV